MMDEQHLFTGLDSEISKIEGIFWKPWIGKKYFDSEERLLIIGESHYVLGETEEEYLKKYEYCKKSSNFTRECIYESAVIKDWHNKTYENIHRTLLLTTNFDRESLWEKLSFYNFIPRTMDYRRNERPEYMDFYNSWKPFIELITLLKPTTCLFIGVEASNSFNAAMA